jgi:hypothetical protein
VQHALKLRDRHGVKRDLAVEATNFRGQLLMAPFKPLCVGWIEARAELR